MIGCRRGNAVLVEFVFTDESGKKLRPALVISSDGYQRGRQEVIIAAITSNVGRRLFGDYVIADWSGAGLLFPSCVTGVVRTVKQSMIARKLGSLGDHDREAFDMVLRQSLGL